MAEDLGSTTSTAPEASAVVTDSPITTNTFQEMLNILDSLVTHTHIFYDDYSTACDCNCNCNCGRGIL